MPLSNPYVRSGIASVVLFIVAGIRMLQKYPQPWNAKHGFMILMMGFACMLTVVIVGTFARKSQTPWPWLKVGVATLGCWFLVLCLMFLTQGFFVSSR